ncbi:sigma-70 RNA polymerase sigma factor region 4 domain-containing protein [Enterococcus mundtii]|uniref:sigma-70 family RNA polymerase sigma factor n=1 Tax=Enterococcus mundtii TaxID=53346 RepID=UPI003855DBF3
MDLKINTRELYRWSNYSDGDDGDLAKHQKFLTALQKQKHLKGVVERLNDRIERLEKERKEIIELIDQFNGLNNRILKLKYVEGMTLESVAEETGYTYQYIKNKHAELMRIIKFNKKV